MPEMTPEERKLYEKGMKEAESVFKLLEKFKDNHKLMEEAKRMVEMLRSTFPRVTRYVSKGNDVIRTIDGEYDATICECECIEYAELIAELLTKEDRSDD